MDLKEVGMVLARVSNFDNRRLDPSVARDWKVMLDRELHGRGTVNDAMEVVLDHFAQPDPPYFTIGRLVDGMRKRLRLTPREIAVDVRSAKARGLVAADWGRDEPLPPEVSARLSELRAEAQRVAPEIEAGESPLALDVGKRP